MYDFPLVLMVAQYSQKDPREYLTFLKDLQNMEIHRQRFTIDDYLKRYKKALTHLSLAGDDYFEDCLGYIQKHSLYSFSLSVFTSSTHQKNRVQSLYADHLMSLNEYDQAGILYSLAGETVSALEAFKLGLQWDKVFTIAVSELHYSQDQLLVQ